MSDLVNQYIATGHDVLVVTSDTTLNKSFELHQNGRLQVFRVKSQDAKGKSYLVRMLIELLMPFKIISLLFHKSNLLKGQHFDLLIWYVPTIFNTPLVARLKKKFNFKVYLIQRDIFPDWLLDLRIIRKGIVFHILNAFCKRQYKYADTIGVQSHSSVKIIQNKAAKYNVPIEVLHNWLTPNTEVEMTSETKKIVNKLKGKKVFLYAGNMGVAQNMGSLFEIASHFRNQKDYLFLFIGRGAMFNQLKLFAEKNNMTNVMICPAVSNHELTYILKYCDIGLVSLDPRHKTDNIPGKILTYLFAGKPVLVRCNMNNDLIELVENEDIGFATSSENIGQIGIQAERILERIKQDKNYSQHCQKAAERLFSTKAVTDQILKIVQ